MTALSSTLCSLLPQTLESCKWIYLGRSLGFVFVQQFCGCCCSHCRKTNRRNQSVCPARKSPMVRFTKPGLRTIPSSAHPFYYRIVSRLHLSTSLCKRSLWEALRSSKRAQKAEKFMEGSDKSGVGVRQSGSTGAVGAPGFSSAEDQVKPHHHSKCMPVP